MARSRVAITGLGLVSPYGAGLEDFFSRLLEGQSAVELLVTADKPRPLSIPFVRCAGFDPVAELGKPLAGMMDRFAQLAVTATFAAWDDAGFARTAVDDGRERWGVCWGTALGGTLSYEKVYRELWQEGRERLSPLTVVLGMNNAANSHVSIQLGLGGASMSYTVACASSAIATVIALRERAIPPTANLDRIDPECAGLDHVTVARRGVPLRVALSNSFAFGGSNAVLAFRSVTH